jgi:hypothetical protein
MKIVHLIARLLLGVLFTFTGLNGFLNFIPAGPMPPGPAGQFAGVLMQSHYMHVVFIFQLIPGILLLLNRYVPLALALLAPVIVNILLFHIFMYPSGLPLASLAALLWILTFIQVRYAFAGLFQQRVGG